MTTIDEERALARFKQMLRTSDGKFRLSHSELLPLIQNRDLRDRFDKCPEKYLRVVAVQIGADLLSTEAAVHD